MTPAAAKTAIFDQITQQHIDFMLSKIPRARFVLVEELASMVAWMASEENSLHDRRGVRHLRRACDLLSDMKYARLRFAFAKCSGFFQRFPKQY